MKRSKATKLETGKLKEREKCVNYSNYWRFKLLWRRKLEFLYWFAENSSENLSSSKHQQFSTPWSSLKVKNIRIFLHNMKVEINRCLNSEYIFKNFNFFSYVVECAIWAFSEKFSKKEKWTKQTFMLLIWENIITKVFPPFPPSMYKG